MLKMVFFKSFTKFGWVFGALLEFKSRPKFDEGIFESYVHLNLVVLDLNDQKPQYFEQSLNTILLSIFYWI